MECYYFGTFNPVHLGHIQTALDVLENFNFKTVVFLPSFAPPHKKTTINPIHRLNMLKLIENDKIKVSDIEFRLETPSFSYKTLEALLKTAPVGEKINFIIGFDAFKNIEKWKNPDVLKHLARFIVLKRTGEDRAEIEKLREKGYDFVIADNVKIINISSTEIRKKAQEGKSLKGLVDKKVEEYINEHKLYKTNS